MKTALLFATYMTCGFMILVLLGAAVMASVHFFGDYGALVFFPALFVAVLLFALLVKHTLLRVLS